jgi:hypothetical protein
VIEPDAPAGRRERSAGAILGLTASTVSFRRAVRNA